jgi:hypothetical protein
MSRSLPSHPNLEHLKKQAKDLLRDLQQDNPALKLADVQHALAREYGFASWPKLRVYVESLPRPVTPDATDDDGSITADNGSVPEGASPFMGKWRANLSKSRRHPANQFQSATLQFTVDGDIVTIIGVIVDDVGFEQHGKNTILADSHEHVSEERNGYMLMAKWRGSHVLETEAKKDGEAVGWGRYEVSEDGKTLTISGDEQMIVLDRN